jgi:hypothetical protein
LSGRRPKRKDARPPCPAESRPRRPEDEKVEALLLADCLREVKKHGGRVQKQQD